MVNDRLRDAMHRLGQTPDTLADATGVDRKTVERWITRGRSPYPRHRHTIAALVQESESYLWPDAVAPERAAEVAGSEVIAVYPHRNSIPREVWDRLIGTAGRRVDVLAHAALFLGENPALIKAWKAAADNGADIRIAFGDPASRAVALRGEEERLGKGVLGARIRNALAAFTPLRDTAGVQIRFHRATLYNSIFRFDYEMIVNAHVYGIQGAHAPALHLRRLSAGNLFETYTDSFATVWDTARPATW